MDAVTLVRYDEIGLKGRNRRFFEGRLRENIARVLGLPASAVLRERGRLFVELPEGRPADAATLRSLARVFGIRSFSQAWRVPNELAPIREAVLRLASQAVVGGGTSFAIETRRAEKSFPLTSLELNVDLGQAVQDAHAGLVVDLGSPGFTIHLEVRHSSSYVYERILPGPGGLPVGSGGKALLLLSGGIDSPVAGWMALKRGLALDAVHFHSPPYTSARARDKAVAIARELSAWRGHPLRVHLISVTAVQQAIGSAAPERLWTVMLRRMMVRIAAAIARRDHHGALVTGDSLGQVASQTLENMAAVDRAAEISVLRPLVGFDKMEIVERARRIGTYGLSIQPFEDCCVLFSPRRPETHARAAALAAVEERLPLEALLDEALAGAETVDLDPRPPRPTPAPLLRSGSLSSA